MVGGKLYCHACRKEIEWTYYMSPRTICLILHSFHPSEIQAYKDLLVENILKDPELLKPDSSSLFEEMLDEYISNTSSYIDIKLPPKPTPSNVSTQENTVEDDDSGSEVSVVEEPKNLSPQSSVSSSEASSE